MSKDVKSEREVHGPRRHPALRIAGIFDGAGASSEDAAREHDRVAAVAELKSWSEKARG